MSTNINTQEQKYKNPSAGAIIGGVAAGSTVCWSLTKEPRCSILAKTIKSMNGLSNSLSEDEFTQVEKAVVDTIKKSGLNEKGVSIIKATTENADEITKIVEKAIDKAIDKSISKFFPKKWIEPAIKSHSKRSSKTYVNGENAAYMNASKKIIIPEKKLGLAFFHEAGHAMNANLSKFGKVLQKCRYVRRLALPIAMIALLKTKKAPGEEPKSTLDKVMTFVKNNAGKLTFAACIPILLEEGLATIKGNKFAKQLLSPELARKVAKTNALGFSTYLLSATLSGLGIFLGTKVKDSIASRKLVEENK